MLPFLRVSPRVPWASVSLALLVAFGCAGEKKSPPPIFNTPTGGSSNAGDANDGNDGGADGSDASGGKSGVCKTEKTGCSCDEPGSTFDCKEYENFEDYVTCTIGVVTCQEDLRWGPCIGERTTQPAATTGPKDGTREN